MKKTYKSLNILGYILVAVLVFLCGFNVTYAYFTARATVQGNLQFYDLNVQFAYYAGEQYIQTGTNEYEIIPATNNILRGVPFGFKTADNEPIDSVGLQAMTDSCPYYARVKVKAVRMILNGATYTQDTTDTTDYGNYVELTINEYISKSSTGYYYFKGDALTADSYATLATGAKILATAPAELTSSYLKITLSFEAVQADKEAVKSAFNLSDSDISSLEWTF